MLKGLRAREGLMSRVAVLQRVADKKITQKEAGKELELTARHIRRLMQIFKGGDFGQFVPKWKGGNRSCKPEFKQAVLRKVKELYHDFGPTFASEKLEEDHGLKVSKETLRKWMIEAGLWHGKKRRKASIHQSRERRCRFGELVQIDGSHHDWFEGRANRCCLLVMIDDATSKIVYMRFEEAETTMGYMRSIASHVLEYGRPVAYYSDKHSIFKTTNDKCVDRITTDTQLHRALKELKIELICAHSPQAKGRVERANGILQDRLIKEMRLKNISSIEEANQYLPSFIKSYNAKFGVGPASREDAHRPLLTNNEELDFILSKREIRKVSKNLECSFNNKIYQIQAVGHGYRLRQASVTICETRQGETKIIYEGKPLAYTILERTPGPKEADDKELNLILDRLTMQKYDRQYITQLAS